MSLSKSERIWTAMVEEVAELGREWISNLDNINNRHDAWVKFRQHYDVLTPKRQRQVMRRIFEQQELVWAQDAEDEIIFGNAPDYGSVKAVCWVCDRELLDREAQTGSTCLLHRGGWT